VAPAAKREAVASVASAASGGKAAGAMSTSLLVQSLPLAPATRQRLIEAGFQTARDLAGLTAVTLSQQAGVSREEALLCLQLAGLGGDGAHDALRGAHSALELSRVVVGRIPTFCRDLDLILGGGVETGCVTELVGVPGVGKTQLCAQLALNAGLPSAQALGLGSEALYVDTEGSLVARRLRQIASGTGRFLASAGGAAASAAASASDALDPDAALRRIHVVRARDRTDLLAVGAALPRLLDKLPRVRLVVVDSVTFPFRHGADDVSGDDAAQASERSRALLGLGQQLTRVANERSIAVVVTNQVTTRVGTDNRARLVPALGDAWGHVAAHRVLLFWRATAML